MGDVHNRGTKDRPRWYCRNPDIEKFRRRFAESSGWGKVPERGGA
jgi:hypothetical protein